MTTPTTATPTPASTKPMVPNANVFKGKWLEIKGEVRKAWGKLTDDELEKTHGDMQAINGLIQQRYGAAQGHYTAKLEKIFKQYEDKKEEAVKEVKKSIVS